MLKGDYFQIDKGWRLIVLILISVFLISCGGPKEPGTSLSSSRGNQLVSPPTAPPSIPTGVRATAGNGEATINWIAVDGATSYNIYYLMFPGKTSADSHPALTIKNSKQMTAAVSGVPITGLANGETYYFIVTAVNEIGESGISSEMSAKPMPNLPGIPTSFQVTAGAASVNLSWQKVVNAISYNVYYGTSPGLSTSSLKYANTQLTSQLVGGLSIAPGHYYFMVTAVNDSGESGSSVELVTTAKSAYKTVAAGANHSVALRIRESVLASIDNGGVYSWGQNINGQLGTNGSPSQSAKPLESALSQVTAVAAGANHTVALTTDKSVYDWGLNDVGQLGQKGKINTLTGSSKYLITNTTDMKAVAAGFAHTVALRNDGTVWAWGDNEFGQLARKSVTCKDPDNPKLGEDYKCDSTPSQVYGVTRPVVGIAAGDMHTLALDDNGTVWAWGRNDTGQLGGTSFCDPLVTLNPQDIGFSSSTATSCGVYPVQVTSISDAVIAVSAGVRHSVALTSKGEIWTWGGDFYGQLGSTSSSTNTCYINSAFSMNCTPDPGKVIDGNLNHIVAISAGAYHTLALRSDGTVWTWGYNLSYNGELKDTDTRSVVYNRNAVQITQLSGIVAIAAGAYHSLALKNDGSVWAWGYNGHGQLGDNSVDIRVIPVKVQGLPDPVVVLPGL